MLRAELALMPDIQHTDRFTINGTVYAVRQVEKHTPTHGEVMVRLKEAT
jgi:hypothetical protein